MNKRIAFGIAIAMLASIAWAQVDLNKASEIELDGLTGVGPTLTREVNQGAWVIKQRHDFRADHAPVQLAHGVDTTAKQPNLGKVTDLTGCRVNKDGWEIVYSEEINGLAHV